MTSAWGKQVWSLPLDNPEYQVVVQMKHAFSLQPVPASTDSVVGVSWEAIARKLQDRLRNANIQDQTSNPWFKKAWAATLDRVCAVQVDKIKTEEDLGFSDSKPGDSFQGRRTCSLAKHTFTVHNSLILIDAILQAANVLQYADIFCKRWHRGEGCGSRTWFQKEPNGWGKLSDYEKGEYRGFVRSYFSYSAANAKLFSSIATELNLTGQNPDRAKYTI